MNAPIFIVGPTASGKSALALALAESIGGEIISVDSMQVYRGLDIGTAKPSADERRRVTHHLIDVVDLDERFDAAQFVDRAHAAERDICSRGKTAVFCGGTGLYVKAYLEGLGIAPSPDAELRKQLEAAPLQTLLEELRQQDPATYQRIDRKNPRRVIRALEVIRLTGKPFSEQRSQWQAGGSPALPMYALVLPAGELHMRINKRVDEMFARGLVAETRNLLRQGLEGNPTAMQALGYRQVVQYLRGERSLAETTELVKSKTRQFAKRQMTWFRRQLPVRWVEPRAALETIMADLAQRPAATRPTP